MIVRIELFDHYKFFDIEHEGKHYYVYGLPYYDGVWDGRIAYPDGYRFYIVPGPVYTGIMVLKQSKSPKFQSAVYDLSDMVLNGSSRCVYIGDSSDYIGPEISCAMQAFVKYLAQTDDWKNCYVTVS